MDKILRRDEIVFERFNNLLKPDMEKGINKYIIIIIWRFAGLKSKVLDAI